MKKVLIFISVLGFAVVTGISYGVYDDYSRSTPKTEEQLVMEIMSAPAQLDKIKIFLDKETEGPLKEAKDQRDVVVTRLKDDLRKLHVLNPKRADKIVDENFPSLWGDGRKNPPIWKRDITPIKPEVHTTMK